MRHICCIITLLTLLFTACKNENHVTEPTPRTILVYMVANNSLGEKPVFESDTRPYDRRDLDEMAEAAKNGDLGKCRWIVYHHAYNQQPQLLELTTDGFKTVKTYDNATSSVTITRMREVIADTKRTAPAEDYGLVLWSHASGWLEDGISEPEVSSRSFGIDNGRKMNITSLNKAITGEGFSFVYADCCNMSTIEVAYELRNSTKIFAGSATELPANGMPYDLNMKYFTARQADIIGAARTTYEYYAGLPKAENWWCTMGVVNTSALDKLAEETRRVYQSSDYPAGYSAQSLDLYNRYYFDFKHFVDALSPDDTEWNKALDNAVIYCAYMPRFISVYIESHCGLATFIQNSTQDMAFRNYNNLEWFRNVARYQPLPGIN